MLPARERQRVSLGGKRKRGAWLKPQVVGWWPARLHGLVANGYELRHLYLQTRLCTKAWGA